MSIIVKSVLPTAVRWLLQRSECASATGPRMFSTEIHGRLVEVHVMAPAKV